MRALTENCRDGETRLPTAECQYAIARMHFESRRWAEAARWFRRAALENADREVAIFAGQLYLDSLNVLASQTKPARHACYELMAEDAERIACALCRNPQNEVDCRRLSHVRFEIRWLLDKGGPPAATAQNPMCKDGEQAVGNDCHPLPPLVPATCKP